MRISQPLLPVILAINLGFAALLPGFRVRAADSNSSIPAVIQDGFALWTKRGISLAFDAWKKGGLLDGDNKPSVLSSYFQRIDRVVGNYKSYELIEMKKISPSSQIIYLSLNFDRAAIFARFLVFRADKDWVVQNMDFSQRPEVIMPWFAFEGVNYTE